MTAPANDDLANAVAISGATGSVGPVTIDDATTEGSEIGFAKNQSIWYVIHAADNATGVYLSTQGSLAGDSGSGDGFPSGFGSLDTRLAVFEATTPSPSYAALFGHQIVSNEDHDVDEWWSEVTFNVTSGKYYFIQIGTFDVGYTGTVVLGWTGVPVPPPPPEPAIITYVGCASTAQLVPAGVQPIPILMPEGIEAGDYLVASLGTVQEQVVNVLDSGTFPPGWDVYNSFQFVKLADGSESGALINWTSNDTSGLNGVGIERTCVAIVTAYRFSVPPIAIQSDLDILNFGDTGNSASSGPIGGVVAAAQMRVFAVFGGCADDSSLPTGSGPIVGYAWTNVTARCGLVTENWDSTNGDLGLNDSVGMSAGDVVHDYTGSVYEPGDAVTIFGDRGAFTGGDVTTTLTFVFASILTVAYWGINATTPA